MATKKRAKKRLPKPVPCERWGIFDKFGDFNRCVRGEATARSWATFDESVHLVRIVPVVAKRRKGAK